MLCTQMKFARQGECGSNSSFFPMEIPVRYESKVKVIKMIFRYFKDFYLKWNFCSFT